MEAVALFDPVHSAAKLKQAANDLGFKVIAVFTLPLSLYETQFHIPEKSLCEGCDAVIFSSDPELILKQLKDLLYRVKGSIPGLESGVEAADQIADRLHLPGNRVELSSARRDKGKMRAVLKQNGFSCPDFSICKTKKEATDFALHHSFPLVIKTPRGAATSEVYVCDNLESVLENFHKIQTHLDFFGEPATSAILESFIGGNEYVINTFSDGEKVHITDIWMYEKIQTEAFKNIYHSILSLPLSDPRCRLIQQTALQIAKAFGMQRGAAHLEFKDDPILGPTLIEIGGRLAGAKLPEFVKKYSNFDPYRSMIEVFTKGYVKIPDPIVFQKHFAVAYCPIFKNGRVEKISGIDQIQALSSYENHSLSLKEGDILSPTTHLSTVPLTVFLAHSDRKHLLKDVEAVHRLFQVQLY